MSYSQNNEEAVILELFKDRPTGRFLDIGAWNGKNLSNTCRLAELGWSGLCVEPSPKPFVDLLALHGDNPKIQLLNCALTAGTELLEFYDSSGDAVSTACPAHAEKWEKGSQVRYKKFWIQTLALPILWQKFGFDFEFINLDVECLNWQLFQALPFAELTDTRAICVEHDGYSAQMKSLAAGFGFTEKAWNGENLILAR